MALFGDQFASVVEWKEFRDDVIFWRWGGSELKKSSRLIVRPGQDAIFLYNGQIEGIFKEEGNYEIESQIIPFLSSLKGFKFGFNSGLRAEVLFVNTKEFTVPWGTPNAVNIPAPGLPGGLPVRAFGTFVMKVGDYVALMDKIAGTRQTFAVEDVKQRVTAVIDQYLMKWIAKEGKDVFHLQINAAEIGKGICTDLDMAMNSFGLSILDFVIANVNYPPEVQAKIDKAASYSMVGDVDKYREIGMIDAMAQGGSAGAAMGSMAGLAAGMKMAEQLTGAPSSPAPSPAPVPAAAAVACAACRAPVAAGAKFCPSCGVKMEAPAAKFCANCGKELGSGEKFCPECGTKQA